MNYKKLNPAVISLVVGIVLCTAVAAPAFALAGITATVSSSANVAGLGARVGASASVSASVSALTARETQLVDRADMEITNRVSALTALGARVNAMLKLSSSEKSSLSSQLQAQIAAMDSLQAQVVDDQNSNNTSSLKADVQSITKAYRIYALILPQAEIAAASDRVMTIASAMTTLSGDLQTRITAAQSAGVNMDSSVSALADLNAKVADANTQVQAALNATASLMPDNGNATVMASNIAALKGARDDIHAAQKDFVTARQDAITIIAAIKAAEKVQASASANVSASTSAAMP